MEEVTFYELKKGDNVWFKSPYNTFSHWGTVKDFHYNFEGDPYVTIAVGKATVMKAYENFKFIAED
ncbi:hypothetical protein RJC26_12060 [Staphylococcus capitis]|uniref:hypothetical protein n=1 Tax=Staphylococcus capitis TaxID=29388 RepID=UPI0028795EEF|nr:hypothetical protein [Staphylococcus capitis]MDS4009679.1 hypothetical protein [Staphylococcus capitis]